MPRHQGAQIAFILVLIAWALYLIVAYAQTPDTVASHFDGRGVPNDWSSKNVFYGICVAAMMLLVVIFLWIPTQKWFFTHKVKNLPNSEYWLAPERFEETADWFKAHYVWMGAATAALEAIVTILAIDANLNPPPRLSSMAGWVLLVYFVFLAVWLFQLFNHFRRIPDRARAV